MSYRRLGGYGEDEETHLNNQNRRPQSPEDDLVHDPPAPFQAPALDPYSGSTVLGSDSHIAPHYPVYEPSQHHQGRLSDEEADPFYDGFDHPHGHPQYGNPYEPEEQVPEHYYPQGDADYHYDYSNAAPWHLGTNANDDLIPQESYTLTDYPIGNSPYGQTPVPFQSQVTYGHDDDHEHDIPLRPQSGSPFHTADDAMPMIEQSQVRSQSAWSDNSELDEVRSEYQDEEGKSAKKSLQGIRQVKLLDGNLVLDCPVPPSLLKQVYHGQREFTHMRYSAVTCDPADFLTEKYALRQGLFKLERETELFIAVTLYNEDDFLFARTMSGVFKNIDHICNHAKENEWNGKEAWKKIVVCVIADGRAKINQRARAVLAGLGAYQKFGVEEINGKGVTSHIYEYTTQMHLELDRRGRIKLTPRSDVPVQIIFCLKEKNQKKINSHRWFFQAFGAYLKPKVCVLLDAGTKPGGRSIYDLWRTFHLTPTCGGACGEIKVMTARGKNLLNPLVAGQNFEYKMSNILDKPLESAFGFISVLPGAFSAYRYEALLDDETGQGPLEKYFAGEKMHANAGIFTANMYLAEDRILCFELVSKRKSSWILQYVKSATGETDVPDKMSDFILQRRRWLNGSFFAAVYSIAHFWQIGRSSHSVLRKFMLIIEFIYQTINIVFSWFAIGNFFLVFRILTTSLSDKELLGTAGRILGVIFEWLYLFTLVSCFILALGNRPGGANKFYLTMVTFWCGLMIYLMFAAIYVTVRSIQEQVKSGDKTLGALLHNSEFTNIIISLASTYVLYFVTSIIFLDPWHMITCFLQYIMLTPTYVNILNIYAFCNTHDITWGTKGDDKAEKLGVGKVNEQGEVEINIPTSSHDIDQKYQTELMVFTSPRPEEKERAPTEAEQKEDYYQGFRSTVVIAWITCNFALAAVVLNSAGFDRITSTSDNDKKVTQNGMIYMAVILWSVAGLALFRFLGAMWFLFVRMFRGV